MYIRTVTQEGVPRLPLEGEIDLTYRCNFHCRHCWLRLPVKDPAGKKELTFDEIGRIVAEARAMGCQSWSISGGEPLLRPDFAEIFGMLTRNSLPYSLNTNGALITPAIARLLKAKGTKMVALYGATKDIHDHITRTPGSFEATMQGFAYLREAKTGFIVQLIPMRDNHRQYDAMIRLAKSLSPVYRMGAPWLYFSACRNAVRNREISRQRLDPAAVISLDPSDMMDDDEEMAPATPAGQSLSLKRLRHKSIHGSTVRQAHSSPRTDYDILKINSFAVCPERVEGRTANCDTVSKAGEDDRLFAACIAGRRDFHIDPYGGMTFCCFVKEPALRYNLQQGTFREAWDEFIPPLADKMRGDSEYWENCGRCAKRHDCQWCPAYGYLEHGRYSAKVPYLCRLADETRSHKENWQLHHRRYFRIAGITIQVDSDLPFTEKTFDPKFRKFQADGAGEEMISLSHHFSLPKFNIADLGKEVYRKPPWAIYRKGRSWIYLGIAPQRRDKTIYSAAVFNEGHTRGRIYNSRKGLFRKGNLHSLTMFPSDQILLARMLADREACFLHASGIVMNGKGLLFVGHSGAGKTTVATMLREQGKVLCDDRIIVRSWPEGLRIHGTWSHGDLAEISADDAPLSAIFFLEKAATNRLIPVTKRREIAQLLVQHVVKSLITADWWEKILALMENIAGEVPVYRLRFDKSGRVADVIGKIL